MPKKSGSSITGFLAGLAIAGVGLLSSWLMETKLSHPLFQKISMFLLIAPYAFLTWALSLFSTAVPASLEFLNVAFVVVYWILIGGFFEWLFKKQRLVAFLLAIVLLIAHGWAAIEFERKTKAMAEFMIQSFAKSATKWGPPVETMIREESKKAVSSKQKS